MSKPARGLADQASKLSQLQAARAKAAELAQHLDDSAQLEDIHQQPEALGSELSSPAAFITLTDEQQAAVNAVLRRAFSSPEARVKEELITGPAGSGKSTITRSIAEALSRRGLEVMGMAFTHNAAQRLYEVSGIESFTTSSALAIRPKWENGKQVYRADPYSQDRIDQADVWIVDECSMLPPEHHAILRDKAGGDQLVIYVGDDEQLTPIVKREGK